MAIKFGGEFEITRALEDVYDFLTDPKKFAPLLPDFQNMTQQDDTHFTVKVNVGISYIKGAADMKMELSQAERPKRAQYKGQGSAAGGKVAMTAGFDLQTAGSGTKVVWQGEAQVFGSLASVAGGLLEPLGKKNVQKLIDGLQTALSLDANVGTAAPTVEPTPAVEPNSAVEPSPAKENIS
jgi:carbon monoxide dehydrogenase subunit G